VKGYFGRPGVCELVMSWVAVIQFARLSKIQPGGSNGYLVCKQFQWYGKIVVECCRRVGARLLAYRCCAAAVQPVLVVLTSHLQVALAGRSSGCTVIPPYVSHHGYHLNAFIIIAQEKLLDILQGDPTATSANDHLFQ